MIISLKGGRTMNYFGNFSEDNFSAGSTGGL